MRPVICGNRTRFRRGLAFVVGWVWLAVHATAQPPDPPLEFQPYRVQILLAFEETPELSSDFRKSLVNDLRGGLWRTFGETWTVAVEMPTPGSSVQPNRLGTLLASQLPVPRETVEPDPKRNPGQIVSVPTAEAPDKVMLLSVSSSGSGFRVAAREWDRMTDELGPTYDLFTGVRDAIDNLLLRATVRAFRPVGLVIDAEPNSAILRLRAAAIPAPDPEAVAIPNGRFFSPVFRKTNRDGQLIEIRPVPFTYLETVADESPTEGAEAAERLPGHRPVAVRSALRSTLAGRRGTVEAWAIAVEPSGTESVIHFVRRRDDVPLAGRIVEVRDVAPRTTKVEPEPLLRLLTDRLGAVTIPRREESPLLWLSVKSGDALLLWLPVIPGADADENVPLGDDPARLDAEGRLAVLNGELIETVAKRATLLAKARVAARADKFDEAKAALTAAGDLPTAEAFNRRLAAIEAPALKTARDTGDRLAGARIQKLSEKTGGLIEKYLNPDALKSAREEVQELEKAYQKTK